MNRYLPPAGVVAPRSNIFRDISQGLTPAPVRLVSTGGRIPAPAVKMAMGGALHLPAAAPVSSRMAAPALGEEVDPGII